MMIRMAFLVFALTLSGCSSFELRDANSQLTALYSVIQSNQQSTRSSARIAETNARNSLARLAVDAAAAADKVSNVASQIAFLRIAATAAWQSLDFTQAGVYADKGTMLCIPANIESVPRDCGMLSILPDMAAIDQNTLTLNRSTDLSSAELNQLFDDYSARISSLLGKRNSISSAASPGLIDAIDASIGEVICEKLDTPLRPRIIQANNFSDSVQKTLECRIKSLFEQASQAGVATTTSESALSSCAATYQAALDCN